MIEFSKLYEFLFTFSVTEIRSKGKNTSDTYIIPDEFSFSQDIVLEQLQLMDTLFPSSTKARNSRPDVAVKRNSLADDKIGSSAKRQKVETEVKSVDSQASTNTSTSSTGTSDKHEIVNTTQPVSRIEFKESLKRAFEISKANTSDLPTNVTPAPSKPTTSSSKVTKDIHQYISVVNPKGQMQKKLDRAAPYNLFLTTITDSKQTHREPLSITFQGKRLRHQFLGKD